MKKANCKGFKILTASALALTIAGGIFAGAPSANAERDVPEAAGTLVWQSGSVCVIPARAASYGQIRIPARKADVFEKTAENAGIEQVNGEETEVIIREKVLHVEEDRIEGILPEISWQNGGNSVTFTQAWYTDEELELLACTVYCEAGGDEASDETRMMVAQVVLNRVNDPRFPGSIKEVLTQKSQYGRFYWTGVVWPSRAAHEPEAVERAYDCARRVLDGERPLPEDTVWQAEFMQGTECVVHVPGFYFCK